VSSIYQLARAGYGLAKWTPRGARHGLGSVVGSAIYLGWKSKRRNTQQNMAHITGRPARDPYTRRLASASWKNYGRIIADFVYFPHFNFDQLEHEIHDLTEGASGWKEYVEQALVPGRGIVIASAHFGNYDMAAAYFARHFPFSIVTENFADPQMTDLVLGQRKERGIGLIPMEGSARRILRTLQQNQLVAIAVDRPVSREEGVEINFFGHKTYVPGGPAALALKSGAAILPGFMWYGRHNECFVRAFPPIFPHTGVKTSTDKTAEIARLTQCMFDAIEEIVRAWPTQWYMFRQFWPSE
jgi:lauroyl/myristoyl acyltransferase